MPSRIDGNPVRVAATLQAQTLATTNALDRVRSAEVAAGATDLQANEARVQATTRLFRESLFVGGSVKTCV
jgi:hypothetical protein